MKKYSVYNLKVVKVETSTNTKYLICRYNNLTHEYIEVLTGEKIEVKKSENVEPLSNYYSILYLTAFDKTEILELTKKDILDKYLEINSEELEKTEERKPQKIVLKKAPEEGYEITDEEMEIINRLNGPKKDEFEKLYLSSEDYDRIYQNVVGDVLEVATKPQEKKGINELSPEEINEAKKKIDEMLAIIPDELKEAINEVMMRVGVIKTSGNTELTELAEGLKRTREELVSLCESDPEKAKELAIEALIRTGVIESSDKIEKGKPYIKERKDK